MRRLAWLILLCGVVSAAWGQTSPPALAPFSVAELGAPPPAWRLVGLPRNKVPLTRMDVIQQDGTRVLQLAADASYATLVHALPAQVPGADATLSWRWKLTQPLAEADLRTKAGDDVALKVCAMFDLPLEALSFAQRSLMRLARAASSEPLPAATLCYVWDPQLPTGTLLPNAYTDRVRYLVLSGREAPLGQWQMQRRNLSADFLQVFGAESRAVPPLVSVVLGADADNTGNRSLGFVGDVLLQP
ncbi:MAG: hypothetical protein RJA34_1155 [Pseudomonadota bacterium]